MNDDSLRFFHAISSVSEKSPGITVNQPEMVLKDSMVVGTSLRSVSCECSVVLPTQALAYELVFCPVCLRTYIAAVA